MSSKTKTSRSSFPAPVYAAPGSTGSFNSVPVSNSTKIDDEPTIYQTTDLPPMLPVPELSPKNVSSRKVERLSKKSEPRNITTNDQLPDYSVMDAGALPLPLPTPEPEPSPTSRSKTTKVIRVSKTGGSRTVVKAAAPLRSVDPVALYEEWVSDLPTPHPDEAADPRGHSKGWFQGFQRYIDHLLRAVYRDPAVRKIATAPELMDIWRRAFTESSFGADSYEEFETIGDKGLGYTFARYVYSRQKNVSPMVLSNYMTYYMSKQNQPKLATALKMDKWILFGEKQASEREESATPSIREDVFEAFAASIIAVGNAVHSFLISEKRYQEAVEQAPIGTECLQRFINTLFDGRGGLDTKWAITAPKTTLLEIASIFGLRKRYPIEFMKPSKPGGNYTVILPDKLSEVLVQNGIKKLPRILASNPDETEAAWEAYNKVAAAGASFKWIKNQQDVSRVEKFVGSELYEEMRFISDKLGYAKLFFGIPEASKRKDNTTTVNLYGSDDNDNVVLLATGSGKLENLGSLKMEVAHLFIAEHSKNRL